MRNKAILLVEDYKSTADIIMVTLKDIFPRISIKHVETPHEAEEELRKKPYAAVMTDDSFVISPGRYDNEGAIKLVKKLRAGELGSAHTDIPVLGLCAHKDTMQSLMEAQATACLDKFDGPGIVSFVRQHGLAEETRAKAATAATTGGVYDR